MNVRNSIFLIALAVVFMGTTTFAITQQSPKVRHVIGDILKELLEKYASFQVLYSEDKVYVNCDKPQYEPGETIWFSVYVRDGKTLQASNNSSIVNVEIINPKGSVVQKYKIISQNGVAQGDYLIEEGSVGGIYKIKAYTEWMLNDTDPAIFEKEVTVQQVILPRLKMKLDFPKDAYGAGAEVSADLSLHSNANQPLKDFAFNYTVSLKGEQILTQKGTTNTEGNAFISFKLPQNLTTADGLLNVMIEYQGQTEAISRSIPISLNNISLSFFPEGGDLVEGLPCRLGFKATNEFGKPADVEGYITDGAGNTVANFESYHKGMGATTFSPKHGEVYMAHITEPRNVATNYPVPVALEQGFVLKSEKIETDKANFKVYSTLSEQLHLVLNVRGKNYATASFNAQRGENSVSLNTKDAPAGVGQVTLFDAKGIERCERLVFINSHKQLSIQVKTDKEKYLPREKVNMDILVKDERGLPMPANLSLSVVNDQLLSFADDKSSNIMSWLLVESDLKGKVEEPNFYFDKKEQKAPLALDYLLMTTGWRRFTWKEIQATAPRTIAHQPERSRIAGVVYDANSYDAAKGTYKAIKGATVTIQGTNVSTTTNENGRFVFDGYILDNPINLFVNSPDNNLSAQYIYVPAYNDNYVTYLYRNVYTEQMLATSVTTKTTVGKTKPSPARSGGFNKKGEAAGATKFVVEEAKPQVVLAPPAMAQPMMVPQMAVSVAEGDIIDAPVLADQNKEAAQDISQAEVKNLKVLNEKIIDADFDDDGEIEDLKELPKKLPHGGFLAPNQAQYYRARQFPATVYEKPASQDEIRSDFRSTLYWNGNITTGNDGKASVSFYTSDEITSFNATFEGIASDGTVGRAEHKFYSQLPVSFSSKLPIEVITEDEIQLPFTFVNNTNYVLKGTLALEVPTGFEKVGNHDLNVSIPANNAITQYYTFKVTNAAAQKDEKNPVKKILASLNMGNYGDKVEQEIKIIPKGFPISLAGSGNNAQQSFDFDINHVVTNSLNATFTAYPSSLSEILSGLEGMLNEPGGCFEQVSSSNYPNILVLNYLQATNQAKPEVSARAKELINKGYKMLVAYESHSGGFEWFGGDPGHEGLTAYGLMEFMDMKKAGLTVDEKMLSRTAEWLMSKKDGSGLFARNPRALHEFGLTDNETMSAYIVWALSEFQQPHLTKELETCKNNALSSKNPYQLGLMANALTNYGKYDDAKKMIDILVSLQNKENVWTHQEKWLSAPGSRGEALTIETASLALLAMMKQQNPDQMNIRKIAEFIRKGRNAYGSFGNTNSTVLALKALVQYAIFSKRTDEAGSIKLKIDGKVVAEKAYEKGNDKPIVIEGLEKYLGEGKHNVEVIYGDKVKSPLPYTIAINYYTDLPTSNKKCVIDLTTKLSANQTKIGETVRLSATLNNKTADGQPMTMAILGIPAGLTVQPWQLKELKEKSVFDFYEIKGNRLVLYYRQMKPNEKREINLDLKAEIAGSYQATASSGYLYYTNEDKHWVAGEKIVVTK